MAHDQSDSPRVSQGPRNLNSCSPHFPERGLAASAPWALRRRLYVANRHQPSRFGMQLRFRALGSGSSLPYLGPTADSMRLFVHKSTAIHRRLCTTRYGDKYLSAMFRAPTSPPRSRRRGRSGGPLLPTTRTGRQLDGTLGQIAPKGVVVQDRGGRRPERAGVLVVDEESEDRGIDEHRGGRRPGSPRPRQARRLRLGRHQSERFGTTMASPAHPPPGSSGRARRAAAAARIEPGRPRLFAWHSGFGAARPRVDRRLRSARQRSSVRVGRPRRRPSSGCDRACRWQCRAP